MAGSNTAPSAFAEAAPDGSPASGWLAAPRWGRPPGLLLLAVITMSGSLPMHMIVPSLPAMAGDLAAAPAAVQLTVSVYLFGLAIGQLVYGPLSDRFGRRPVLLLGLGLYTLASVAAALAPSVEVLLGARVLQSLGGCAGLTLGRAAVRDSAGPAEAAARLALLTLFMSVAPAVAPAIGGYVTVWSGWRSVFAIMALMGVSTFLAVLLVFPETNRLRTTGAGLGPMLASYGRLFRSPRFCGFALGGACSTTSIYAFIAASPFLFIEVMHRPPQEVGLYSLVLLTGVAAGSIVANRLAARIEVGRAARIANALTLVGAALLLAVHFSGLVGPGLGSVALVIAPMLIFMLGVGAASPFALVGGMSVHPEAIGAAAGLHGCVQMLYGAFCTLLVGFWHAHSVLPVALILLGSALMGQVAFIVADRSRVGGP